MRTELTHLQERVLLLWPRESAPALTVGEVAWELRTSSMVAGRILSLLAQKGLITWYGDRRCSDASEAVKRYYTSSDGDAVVAGLTKKGSNA